MHEMVYVPCTLSVLRFWILRDPVMDKWLEAEWTDHMWNVGCSLVAGP